MKLSTRGRYGMRLMLELARNYGKGPMSMSIVSRNQNISAKYLEQLIIPLKKAELVASVRGPKGGYTLSKSPEMINMWEVLTFLELNLALVDCVTDATACKNSANCPIRPVWVKAYQKMTELFKETSLKAIVDPDEKSPKH